MNSGRILVNGSSFYCGNSTSSLCQLALKSDIPNVTEYVHPSTKQCNYSYTHPSTIQCSAATEINNLKSSVSSGKIQVANAITGKGVSASQNDSFATLASKIGQIRTPSSSADAFINAAYVSDDWSWPYITFDECTSLIGYHKWRGSSSTWSDPIELVYTANDYGSGPKFWLEKDGNMMDGSDVGIKSNILKPNLIISLGYSSDPFPMTFTLHGNSAYSDSTLTLTKIVTKSSYVQGDYVYEEIAIPLTYTNGNSSYNYLDMRVSEISLKFHWYFDREMRSTVSVRYP